MKIVNKSLVGLDGTEVLKQADGNDLNVAAALIQCALTPAEQGKTPYTREQATERRQVAVDLYNAVDGQSIDVSIDLVVALRNDLLRLYGPLVSGQMMAMLEGN